MSDPPQSDADFIFDPAGKARHEARLKAQQEVEQDAARKRAERDAAIARAIASGRSG